MTEEHAPHLQATPARQGRWGSRVRLMLVASTSLAALALVAVWAFNWSGLQRDTPKATPAEAASFHTPAQNAVSTPETAPPAPAPAH